MTGSHSSGAFRKASAGGRWRKVRLRSGQERGRGETRIWREWRELHMESRGFFPAKRRTGRGAGHAWRRRADEEKEPSRREAGRRNPICIQQNGRLRGSFNRYGGRSRRQRIPAGLACNGPIPRGPHTDRSGDPAFNNTGGIHVAVFELKRSVGGHAGFGHKIIDVGGERSCFHMACQNRNNGGSRPPDIAAGIGAPRSIRDRNPLGLADTLDWPTIAWDRGSSLWLGGTLPAGGNKIIGLV